MTNLIDKNHAFTIDGEVKQLKKDINGGFLELAKRLKDIRDNKLYLQLDYKTFEAYIAQPELGFDRANVYRFIQIYEKFVVELNVAPARLVLTDWSKLAEITPHITEDNKEELLAKAQTLSRSDLREEMQLLKPTPEVIAPPFGKYSTIVIDPPWPMEFLQLDMRPNQVEMPYKTMSVDELKEWTLIKDIAADDCNLFMWTTHTYLQDALDIVKEWGFKYHVLLTWDKTNGRSLFGFNRRTEFVVYAYKGHITVNQRGQFIDTVFVEKLREHSRKPDIFYSMLANNTPAPRIDIFSREKRDGYDQWGNELDKF